MIYPNIIFIGSNIVLLFLIFLLMKNALIESKKVSVQNRTVAFLLIITYILFSFWGDWFHYNKAYVLFSTRKINETFEDVYIWIISNLTINYISFRIIIWLGAFAIVWATCKRLLLDRDLFLLFLGCCWISLFSYARVIVTMSLLYYGLALFVKPYNHHKILSKIIGISIIGISFFFHKSALFGIFTIIVGYALSKFNRKIYWILPLLFPIVLGIVYIFVEKFLGGSFDSFFSNEGTVTTGKRYMQVEEHSQGIGALIRSMCEYALFYSITIMSFILLVTKKGLKIPSYMRTYMSVFLIVSIVSSVFAFNLGISTFVIFVRFMRFNIVPGILLMVYFYQSHYYSRLIRCLFYVGFFLNAYV